MQLKNSTLAAVLTMTLFGCGGSNSSSSANSEEQVTIAPPAVAPSVENVTCDVSYPLAIKSAYIENNGISIAPIIDREKTKRSSWLPASLDTDLILELSAPALIKDFVITWASTEFTHLFTLYSSKDKENWQLLDTASQSENHTLVPDLLTVGNIETALYIKVVLMGNEVSMPSEILEIETFGCEKEVSHDIDLADWYLSVPTDTDSNGKSDSIKETELTNNYFDSRFFTLSNDGGIVFSTSVSGYKTSTNTKYVRSELREMLRRGNTQHSTQGVNQNNWVFSSAPESDQANAGGTDGQLSVELAVNKVTTTGEDYQIGRVIIGQIHANDDEPARLYYRKLPDNVNGSIYLAHEILDGDDIYYEIIGDRSNSASNPTDGIPLDKKFSYNIDVSGNELTVTLTKLDGSKFSQVVDMSDSGYDQGGQYMYYKAGVYNQNNSGDQHDYVQATFYSIENSHTGYSNSNN